MKMIEFETVHQAIDYASKHGGWLFHSKDGKQAKWYDARHYTMSAIMKDTQGSGFISTCNEMKSYIA